MNDEMSDVILESVREICQDFLALELLGVDSNEPSDLVGQAAEQKTATVLGFSGALRGCVILGASLSTSLMLAGALAGSRFDFLTGNAMDMLGELADLFAGGMRNRLSSHGEISLAPPVVVLGQEYTLNNARIYSRARQFFLFKGGHFYVECCYLKDFS